MEVTCVWYSAHLVSGCGKAGFKNSGLLNTYSAYSVMCAQPSSHESQTAKNRKKNMILFFVFLLHFYSKLAGLNLNRISKCLFENPPQPIWYLQGLLDTETKVFLLIFNAFGYFSALLYSHPTSLILGFLLWESKNPPTL